MFIENLPNCASSSVWDCPFVYIALMLCMVNLLFFALLAGKNVNEWLDRRSGDPNPNLPASQRDVQIFIGGAIKSAGSNVEHEMNRLTEKFLERLDFHTKPLARMNDTLERLEHLWIEQGFLERRKTLRDKGTAEGS